MLGKTGTVQASGTGGHALGFCIRRFAYEPRDRGADLPLDIPGEAADEAADSARHQPQDARQLRGALEALGPAPSSDMLAALFDQAPKRKAESDVFDSLAASVLKHPDGTERRPAAPVARAKRPKVTSLAECRHQALVAAVQKRQAKRDRKRK